MTKRKISPIENGRIRLRLIEESDLPMTLAWRSQDRIRKWFLHSEIVSSEQHEEWFSQYSQRDDDYLFIIEEIRDLKKPVGQISIYKIDWEGKRAEFGRLMIGEKEARGKGIAREATGLILNFAFENLGLDEVELVVKKDNKPAVTIYRDFGFNEIHESSGLKKMVKVKN